MASVNFSGWSRFVLPILDDLIPGAARRILRMKFSKKEILRVSRLSELASEGLLTDEQRRELDAYLEMGSILTIMQSKARIALKREAAGASSRKSA
jgi:hypothetical protein